jgi:hypothetical protein
MSFVAADLFSTTGNGDFYSTFNRRQQLCFIYELALFVNLRKFQILKINYLINTGCFKTVVKTLHNMITE